MRPTRWRGRAGGGWHPAPARPRPVKSGAPRFGLAEGARERAGARALSGHSTTPSHHFPLSLAHTLAPFLSFQVNAAQQYSVALKGYPPLQAWVAAHVAALHAPPAGQEVMVTNGNNAAIEAVLRLFLAPGDALVCEEYTYPHIAESFVLPAGLEAVAVPCDAHGLDPAALDAALGARAAAGRPAKLIYTVPVGQNPTGSVAHAGRRAAVYAVARVHGCLILEDDPYHLLQFGPASSSGGDGTAADDAATAAAAAAAAADWAHPRGLAGLGASYLSLDVDGRVIRLDSFAKALAPGLRLGWATAAPAVIAKLVAHLHGVSLGAGPLAQVLAAELLATWGPAGFEAHVKGVQAEYGRRAAALHDAAERWLGEERAGREGGGGPGAAPARLATWSRPLAGMFMWLRLEGVADAGAIAARLGEAGVVVVPGAYAHASGCRARPCPHVRLSFAGASDADMEAGMERLARVLEDVHREKAEAAKAAGRGGGATAAATRVSPADGAATPDRGG